MNLHGMECFGLEMRVNGPESFGLARKGRSLSDWSLETGSSIHGVAMLGLAVSGEDGCGEVWLGRVWTGEARGRKAVNKY